MGKRKAVKYTRQEVGKNTSNKRQTYIGRNYPGKKGPYLEQAKILIRLSQDDLFDVNFIENLENEIKSIGEELESNNKELLDYGVEVIKEALDKYTPVDTGNLVEHWEVTADYEESTITVHNDLDYAWAMEVGKNGEPNGFQPKGFYPGYYMVSKAFNEGFIKMKAKNKQLQQRLENKYR